MQECKIYYVEGDLIGKKSFNGQPMVGDCFLMTFNLGNCQFIDILVGVKVRRWDHDGTLELIVDYE
jgi:hypothetical protein